jgi:hypothetical protein
MQTHLREIDTEGIHIQSIKEACERLAEPCQTLVHELKVHHVCFKISHGIRKLGKGGFECVQRKRRIMVSPPACRVAKRRS